MTRISRISNPRATLCAVVLLTAVMLALGAFSAGPADPLSAGVPLAGETATVAPCPDTSAPPSITAHGGR